LSYSIGNDYLRWVITSTNGNVVEFKKHLEWAAREVGRMMESAKGAEEVKAKL
jgi:carnitine O-acetyltransferase